MDSFKEGELVTLKCNIYVPGASGILVASAGCVVKILNFIGSKRATVFCMGYPTKVFIDDLKKIVNNPYENYV